MPLFNNHVTRVWFASQYMQLGVVITLWQHTPRRIGLLCIVILPLLLSPQASAATRPSEPSSSATASVPRKPATADQYVPLLNAVQVAVGGRHTCALLSSGGVKCWGWSTYGQLGDGTQTDRGVGMFVPVDVMGLSIGVYAIAAGDLHTCAVTGSAEPFATAVKCWGANRSNQLGDGMGGTSRNAPADVIVPLPIP